MRSIIVSFSILGLVRNADFSNHLLGDQSGSGPAVVRQLIDDAIAKANSVTRACRRSLPSHRERTDTHECALPLLWCRSCCGCCALPQILSGVSDFVNTSFDTAVYNASSFLTGTLGVFQNGTTGYIERINKVRARR